MDMIKRIFKQMKNKDSLGEEKNQNNQNSAANSFTEQICNFLILGKLSLKKMQRFWNLPLSI